MLIIKVILRGFLIILFCYLSLFYINVSADTCSAYFDFICYYQKGGVSEIESFGNNVLNPVVKMSNNETTDISLIIKNDCNNSQTIFYDGDYTNARNMTIAIDSDYKKFYIEVLNSNEEVVKISTTKTIELSNLPNGAYQLMARCYGETYQDNYSYVGYYTVCKLRFQIDLTAPMVTGASSLKNQYITSDQVTVKATDSGSGVANLYMKKPNASDYEVVGESVTISEFEEGLYEFFARDKIGNESKKYYLNYDSLCPVGKFVDSQGEDIDSVFVSESFKYVSEDAGSGISYTEVKTPNEGDWSLYNGELIEELEEGVYQFRSYDNCGNESNIYSIQIDLTSPEILIYGDDKLIEDRINVSVDEIFFNVIDDESGVRSIFLKLPNSPIYIEYANGDKYDINGEYTIYAYDSAGNRSKTIKILLDNQPPIITSTPIKLNSSTTDEIIIECKDLSECLLYCKAPGMDYYNVCASLHFEINNESEKGTYYFYADDILHNTTNVYWINFISKTPVIDIVRDYENNTVYIDWESDSYYVTVNGTAYMKKSIIKQEGEYKVIVEDEREGRLETGFTIEHLYKLIYSQFASCTESGYEIYQCISCGNEYTKNISNPTGHILQEEILKVASCIEEGEIHKKCIHCDYELYEIIPARNHKYVMVEERIVNGVREIEYECIYCHNRYIEREETIWDKIKDFIDFLLNNYFKYLIWILLSLTGIWSIVLGVSLIIAKKEEDKEKAIRYIRTYIISLILIFVIFLICPLLLKGFIYLIS